MADTENTMESTQPSRATMASVDARVARLEQSQAETDRNISLIQLEQQHMRELMTSRFTTLEVAINGQGQKLDSFIARIETMVLDATKSAGDLTSSPVGRQVHERLTKLETKSEVQETFMDQLKGMSTALKWVIGTSVTGFVVAMLSLLRAMGVV